MGVLKFVWFNCQFLHMYVIYDRGDAVVTCQESLALERKQYTRKPINEGLLRTRVPPPACTILDVFEGEYHPLFPPSGPSNPTAILFWANW